MSVHDFKPGETFCVGRFTGYSGEVNINDNLILIWKGQFAYPSYRFLKDGKECHGDERGDEFFGKDLKEVAEKMKAVFTAKIKRCEKLINNIKKLEGIQ